ncbi:hypothetical protein ALC56_05263 [Trachymyrmex septentrionalis]|uniref:UPAR/Ly6 domain-containing protein n=1 Tax=Trachymyrmex septentrionalis TaxID=34720 RepID=A0A195FIU2_9HYME|nr:hypothetical protein ALC56_05263 [Trachymyrmex septentrionalis]
MPNFTKWHFALIIITCVSLGHALECYVCTDQEGNQEKCLNTIKTCEPGQDTCLTEIKWGSNYNFLHGLSFLFFLPFNKEKRKKDERRKKFIYYKKNRPLVHHIGLREPRNNFTSLKDVPLKKNARGCSVVVCLIALISGTRTGSVLLVVEAIGVTTTLL